MWTKEGSQYKVANVFGELVQAKPVRRKMKAILHKTVDGLWVKKITAIHNGVELTGESKLFDSGYWNTFEV